MAIDHRQGASLYGTSKGQHKWIAPPPGAGRLEVCEHCGARHTPISIEMGCDGVQGGTINQLPPVHDYDPIT